MRICLVYQGEYPDSERIEKTAKTLTAAGHEIFLLCNDYGKFPLREEQVGPVHVIRLGPAIASRKWNRALKFPAFINPIWIAGLISVVRRHRIEALQIIDVPLSAAVLAVGRLFGLPVVYDMWENYPEALRGWAKGNWRRTLLKNPDVARATEKWVTARVDHIFTVVDEARDRLIADGISSDKVSVVTNGVDMELFLRQEPDAAVSQLDPAAYKLLYAGAITIERGLDDIIRALPLLAGRVPRTILYIAGNGSDEDRLRKLVVELKLEQQVCFMGWVPFRQIHAYISQSDLCLVPHVYNDFINTTIPNKLFQYMAMSKPVLVSNAKPLARIVRQGQCGFVFESGNPADAADRIAEAYQARADQSIGRRGQRCAEDNYTWERVSGELARVYGELARGAARNS